MVVRIIKVAAFEDMRHFSVSLLLEIQRDGVKGIMDSFKRRSTGGKLSGPGGLNLTRVPSVLWIFLVPYVFLTNLST